MLKFKINLLNVLICDFFLYACACSFSMMFFISNILQIKKCVYFLFIFA